MATVEYGVENETEGPISPDFFKRLTAAVTQSYGNLRPFRENYYNAVQQLAGKYYGDKGTPDKKPLNLLELAVTIISQNLTPTKITTLASTPHLELVPIANDLGLALDRLSEEIDLVGTVELWIKNSLLGFSVVKTGMVPPGFDEVSGYLHDGGQPFTDPVSVEDWVHDIAAGRLEEARFMGNKYRIDIEDLDNEMYNREAAKIVRNRARNRDEPRQERVESIAHGDRPLVDEIRDQVELWDIYLPRENLMITFPCEGANIEQVLRVWEWIGPEGGPYTAMCLDVMPGSVMPNPMVNHLKDLDDSTNRLANKLIRQAENQKTVLAVDGSNADDASRVVDAEDMETIRVDNPEGMRELRFNGPDQQIFSLTMALREWFSYIGGNIDTIGGLGPASGTVGQDKLISESSGTRMKHMAEKTSNAIGQVLKKLAWYLWYDPNIQIPFTKRQKDTGIEIPVVWSAEHQEGDFLDYNITFTASSLQSLSPSERLAVIREAVATFMELYPLAEQQGLAIDLGALFHQISKLANLPELNQLIIHTQGSPHQTGPIEPGKPRNTTRQYERVTSGNKGGGMPGAGEMMALMAQGSEQQNGSVL